MADGSSREEKLAAGLKKFKQFQQRSGKMRKKASESPKSSTPVASSKGTDPDISDSQKEVPSSAEKYSSDLEQTKSLSCSSTDLKQNTSNTAASQTPEKNNLLDSVLKSKSDFDISSVKELSSTESLRQISLQVNGLMSETDAFINGSIENEIPVDLEKSLEKRNQELAQMVNSLRQSNDQLQFQMQELKAKIKRQTINFDKEKQELQEKSHKEQVSLKDQLQVHIQTIGILVAEKTELQSSLSLSQQTAKQKAGEVEELQGRLRASRQRASDLERELITLSNTNQQNEKNKAESAKDVERLKLENYKLSKANEDLKMANVELTEKLNKKIQEIQELEKQLCESHNKLSMSEMQVQHLSSSDSSNENSSQLEEVYHQKLELEKKLSLQKESIDKLINERDKMGEQYQQYIQQLSQQVASLRDEVKQLCYEKEELLKEKNSLKEVLENQSSSEAASSNDDSSELKVQISVLKNQSEETSKKLQAEISNSSRMMEMLKEKEEIIAELEKSINRFKEEQVDHSRLVETMQSDKIAASRAVTQNRELKKQLEELQNGFVSMSNDKLDLTEKLHSEQRITKELGERLSQQEEELQELKDQLSQRETELQNIHKSNTKGIYQQNQIADRMRHYEAQGQLVEMLQKELHQAQEQINELTTQNSELRMAVATQAEVAVSDECQKEDRDSSKRNDLVASLSASVRQLEMERNQMMKQLEEHKANRTNLEEHLKKKESQLHGGINGNNDAVSKDEYDVMKQAMAQLEERFKQTMNRIAELSDERQQLEHLVTQLQGETETIGDYIALYQIQRGLMRKRASEKDEYIAQLARDREDLKEKPPDAARDNASMVGCTNPFKAKLGELQCLVMRLLEERKLYQTTSLNINENLNLGTVAVPSLENHSCEEATDVSEEDFDETNPPFKESEKKKATAKKIIDLLTEIETTNLVEKPVLDSFHPCPVCSGRLITV